nr:hypothetical protein [Baaleninema simplex]
MANDSVGVVYNRLHHFITESPWEEKRINERRLKVVDSCHQTRVGRGFALLLDDTGHRKKRQLHRRCGKTVHRRNRQARQRNRGGNDPSL